MDKKNLSRHFPKEDVGEKKKTSRCEDVGISNEWMSG